MTVKELINKLEEYGMEQDHSIVIEVIEQSGRSLAGDENISIFTDVDGNIVITAYDNY